MDVEVAVVHFARSLRWFFDHYGDQPYFVERDVVCTLQRRLAATLPEPLRVFNDVPIEPGSRRGISADLVVVDAERTILLAVEFKFEPDHSRDNGEGADIWPNKMPVLGWQDVLHDVQRVERFVSGGRSQAGAAIAIDEGGYFRKRAELGQISPHQVLLQVACGGARPRPVTVYAAVFPESLRKFVLESAFR